jgi:hypothetical protein
MKRIPGLWRFYFHYRKQTGRLSVHFRGKCFDVSDVLCFPMCCSKRNKRQPHLVMEGYASEVRIEFDCAKILN